MTGVVGGRNGLKGDYRPPLRCDVISQVGVKDRRDKAESKGLPAGSSVSPNLGRPLDCVRILESSCEYPIHPGG